MKNLILLLLFSLITVGSCQDRSTEKVNQYVSLYTNYVDSIIKLPIKDAAHNWVKIQDRYQKLKINLDGALQDIENKKRIKKRIDTFSSLFKDYRIEVLVESDKLNLESAKILLARSLFGKQYKNKRQSFNWVNNKNIATVYDTFYENVKLNESNYLKQDWDEIKLLHMALESRRKTIEELYTVTIDSKNTIKEVNMKFATLSSFTKIKFKKEIIISKKK